MKLQYISNTSSALQVDYAAGVVHNNIVQLLDVFAEGQHYVIVVRFNMLHQQLL